MKTHIYKSSLLLMFIFFNLLSCNKDDGLDNNFTPSNQEGAGKDSESPQFSLESEEAQNKRISSIITKDQVSSDIVIKVVNNQEIIQPNSKVRIMDKEILTDERGLAIFENITVNKDYLLVTVEKVGFQKGFKTITPSSDGITNINVMLQDNGIQLSLNNSALGGKLEGQGVTLSFPTNALLDKDGNIYKGEAVVQVKYFNMNNEEGIRAQPGTLVGITEDNNEVGLVSEGMLTVDIFDKNGSRLQVDKSKKVAIKMPASTDGPNTIALWHLNETLGLWVEVGQAIKKGGNYEFEVSHFSTYNLDFPIADSINFCVDISYTNGNSASNQFYKILYQNQSGQTLNRCLSTNDSGKLCLRRALPGKYIFIDNQCGQATSKELNISEDGTYNIVYDINDTRTYVKVSGSLADCNNILYRNKFFGFFIDNVPNSRVTEIFVGKTNNRGEFTIYKTLCGNYSGVENATIKVTTNEGTVSNTFPFNFSKEEIKIDLKTCGEIEGFRDSDIINLDKCLTNWVLENRERQGSNTILYFDVKNIKEIDGRCNNYLNCIDFTNLQQLYYFTALEKLVFSIPNDTTNFNFEPLTNLQNLKEIVVVDGQGQHTEIIEELRALLPNVKVTLDVTCIIL